jgi:hypothetical protein
MRLLRWKQMDFANEAIKVGRSKTEHGAGRAVPLTKRAIDTLTEWAKQFPDRKPNHFVFPTEKVGVSGNDEIVEVFDTDPTKAITSWKTAWGSAKTTSGVECRFGLQTALPIGNATSASVLWRGTHTSNKRSALAAASARASQYDSGCRSPFRTWTSQLYRSNLMKSLLVVLRKVPVR